MLTLTQKLRITLSSTVLVSVLVLVISMYPVQADTGVQVTLISPKQGVAINPDLPFVITLAITGGNAATANTCHDYGNPSLLGNLTFGAQAVDVNNLGKQLSWGIPGNDYRRTNGGLVGWSARIIPNGIECSIGVVKGIPGAIGVAAFQQGLSDADYAWFGTKQSNWSGDVTNFGAYSYIDFAWNLNGVITHNKFQANSKGKPTVSIVGLQRGQIIDYEAFFQVIGTMSSDLSLESLNAYVVDSVGASLVKCEPVSIISKVDNGDGTTTYISNCRIFFTESTTREASLSIRPSMRTSVETAVVTQNQIVAINIGKQGVPSCTFVNQSTEDSLASVVSEYASFDM